MRAEAFARYRDIIDDWGAFEAALERPLPTTIWTNTLRIEPTRLQTLLGERVRPLPWSAATFRTSSDFAAGRHWSYVAGLYHVQEEVSMLPVHLLGIEPGDRVLDLCAAPGNKTAQASVALGNGGSVVSNDRSIKRMRASRHILERLGVLNVATTIGDATRLPRAGTLFDRVLVDAPCSGEGTCRKLEDRRWISPEDAYPRLAKTQLDILLNAVEQCRPGGRIVYSTCTFAPEENECVIDALLRHRGDAVRVVPAQIPQFSTSPGVTRWQGRTLRPEVHDTLRIWPHHNDTGGFFIAVLERRPSPGGPSLEPEPEHASWNFEDDREPWIEVLHDRFGIEPSRFDGHLIVRVGRKANYVTNREQTFAGPLKPDAVGIRFMHTRKKYPKLTTAACMQFGASATKNVVELVPEQLQRFTARLDVHLTEPQSARCTATGYVIMRYRGFPMGIGIYHRHSRRVESQFPQGWMREVLVH